MRTGHEPQEEMMPTSMSKAAAKAAETGISPLSPYLICDGAAEAIDFYKAAFGAEEMFRLPGPDGRILHACLSINGASVMLNDEFPEAGVAGPNRLGGSPVSMNLIVDDADAWAARAEKAGAVVVMPVEEQFWGDRFGMVRDPFGHAWSLATPVRKVGMDELNRAAQEVDMTCGESAQPGGA